MVVVDRAVPAVVLVGLLGTGCCRTRKGLVHMHDAPHQNVLHEYVPAERMQLVPSHSLPKELAILVAAVVEYAAKSWQMML